MTFDDAQGGRVLSRREVVALLGLAGAGLLSPRAAGGQGPACVVRPQQSEGPFYVDERLERSDIRSDPATGEARPGVPLALAFAVSTLHGGRCTPLAGAVVDVWHCDALGAYSDVGGATAGQKFLRGYQVTDGAGQARFTTIYPGGYAGRAVHIHFKVGTGASAAPVGEFTSQIYFDDALTDQVHAREPYARRGPRRLRNESDGLFRRGGRELILPVAREGTGYAGTFALALSV
jgi:protocatechuate 3,4-dioxygenase beta subunit